MQIVVDGQVLDISEDELVAVTITANSLEDANFFQSSYTNAFAIPPTKQNRTVLGDITALDATGAEYLATDVQLISNTGLQVLTNGKMLINQFDNEALQVNIIDGIVGFFDELEGVDMQMIAPGSIGVPVERTEANVVSNINNDYTAGYTYATADFGDAPTTTYDPDNMFPFSYFYELLQELASLTTYTFDTSTGLFANAKFRKECLAYSGSRYNEESQFVSDIGGYSVTAGTAGPGIYVNIPPQAYPVPNPYLDAFGFEVFEERKSLFFEAYASIDITTNAGAYEYNVRVRNITQGITYCTYSSGAIAGAGALPTVTFTIQSGLTNNYNNGDYIRLEIDAVTGLNFAFTEGFFRTDDGRSGKRAQGTSPTNLDLYADPPSPFDLDCLGLMPTLSAVDFIKAVWQMWGVTPNVDPASKIITLELFETYANDTANSVDYSSKIDTLRGIEIEYSYGSYTTISTFNYENDDDIDSELYGRGLILISNANITAEEKSLIDLPFSASSYLDRGRLIIPILTGSPLTITEDLTPRNCTLDTTTGSITIGSTGVTDYNTTEFTAVWGGAEGTLTPTTFGLLADNWDRYTQMIQAMQKVTLYLKLTDNEINDIDFFTLIYLSFSVGFVQLNGYYLMQEVKEYTGSETVQVELINVNIT